MRKIKGIIFDMDNTLLRSRIDFEGMKHETFHFLVSRGILPRELEITNHTSSTIIKEAIKSNMMTEEMLLEMWEIPKRFEIDGMKDADLEAGVTDILEELKGKYRMAIVTNNSNQAAGKALRDNDIVEYFDYVVGRESMKSLKPSPDGFNIIVEKYNDISINEWISVGDSWIDGRASSAAGITFISYQGDIEKMNTMGVFPFATIKEFSELREFLVNERSDI